LGNGSENCRSRTARNYRRRTFLLSGAEARVIEASTTRIGQEPGETHREGWGRKSAVWRILGCH
jgi:hypothetical protein